MSSYESFVETIHRMYQAWNDGRMEDFYGFIAEDVVDYNAGDSEAGLAGVRAALGAVREGIPDLRYEVLAVAWDGTDLTAARLGCSGTHLGDFFGDPPTGRRAEWTETRWARWLDGKVVEHWANTDALTMMRQLGLIAPVTRDSW